MKKTIFYIYILAACWFGFTACLMAQEEDESSGKPSKQSILAEEETPFQTIWEKQFEISHTSQQSGQNINSFSFNNTIILSETGHSLSAAIGTSRLKVEGADSTTGSISLGAGLGLDFFSPSLMLGFQAGESALQEGSLNLSCGFRFTDSFAGSLSLGGSSGNHQGPLSELFPIPGELGDVLVEIGTKSWFASLGFSYMPWDWLLTSLSIQNSYDITYQIQNLAKTQRLSMDQGLRVASVTLGFDFMPWKGWVFGISPQVGQEYYPSGFVYSPQAGKMVAYSEPTRQNFASWSTSISFSFE